MASRPLQTHAASPGGGSKCGKPISVDHLTDNEADVTCLSCRGYRRERSKANMVKARKNVNYGDADFPGLGILRCHVCGQPCNTHRIFEHAVGGYR